MLPARPGVVVFEAGHGDTLLIATTGDVRGFVRRRFDSQWVEESPRRINYQDLTRRVFVVSVGSAFEADVTYLALASQRMPTSYRAAADRWRGWFVHIDPDAQTPIWRKTNLSDLAGVDAGPRGVFLGPIADKDAAGRYMELLDDLFDLCRYPKELAKAPNGCACAYKEMGKCPGACDGSESLETYRTRVRDAIEFAATPLSHSIESIEEQMRDAALETDFEAAKHLRSFHERLAKAAKPALKRIGRLDQFKWLFVLPGEAKGWARLIVCAHGRLVTLLDVDAAQIDQAMLDVCQAIERTLAETSQMTWTAIQVDTVGLICRHLFKPKLKAGAILSMQQNQIVDVAALKKAVRSAAKMPDAEITDQELDAVK